MESYLLIVPNDFFAIKRRALYNDKFAFMESVLRHMERYDIPHTYCYDSIRVYARDLFEVMSICDHLRITEINYYENGKLSNLFKKSKGVGTLDRLKGPSFDLIASKSLLKNTQTIDHRHSLLTHTTFAGTLTNLNNPKLGLFGPIEVAIQGSFIV